MTSREIKAGPVSPAEIYFATVAEFEKRKQEILAAAQAPPPAPSLWEKLFRPKKPTAPSAEEQLAALEAEFSSWLHSNRQMVVCHLKANQDRQEEIITGYLQSPKLLKDSDALGQFFAFWLLEFFQKADTGPIENIYQFIKKSAKNPLPPELHQARREIFEPLFTLLNGREKEIFEKVKQLGLFGVGQQLSKSLIETNKSLPNGLKKEYQKYVDQLLRIEAGIVSVGPAEPEPKKPRPKRRTAGRLSQPPETEPQSEPPFPPETSFSFWIVLGPNKEPTGIRSLEELAKVMKKIKRLGPVTPEAVWQILQEVAKMDPFQRMERYGERVAGGPFGAGIKLL